jgi:hypothetical protein
MRGASLKGVLAGVVAVVLSACTVGPDYRRPDAPVPALYKEAGWKVGEPLDAIDRGAWWSVYKDSLLDDLEKQIDISNQNLKAAEVRSLPSVTEQPDSIRDILEKAEAKFAKKETAKALISRLFDKLTIKAASPDFVGELFDAEVVEHSNYQEMTTRAFIIRILRNEKRPDNFVTVTLKPEYRERPAFSYLASLAAGVLPDDVSHYELNLNCELEKAQLKITLTPKFVTLKRFVLVVSCAPSLEVCYVMEMLTQHLLRDWGVFDFEGTEVVRRWYKLKWTDPCDFLVDNIFDKLRSAVQESVDAAARALSQN